MVCKKHSKICYKKEPETIGYGYDRFLICDDCFRIIKMAVKNERLWFVGNTA